MGLKGKIISTCLMIALTLCSAVAIGFAYSNPGINITSPTSFNVDGGVQANVSTTLSINGENIALGETGQLTISATSSTQTYNITLPERSFSVVGDKIIYTFTITNTKTDTVGSNFTINSNFIPPNEEINECVSITSNFSTLSTEDKLLEKDEAISITFTMELLSESTSFTFEPSISFSLLKA